MCRLAISQKWPEDGFRMVKNTSELDDYFIENHNEENNLLKLIELNKSFNSMKTLDYEYRGKKKPKQQYQKMFFQVDE